jgi:hypothetical protein
MASLKTVLPSCQASLLLQFLRRICSAIPMSKVEVMSDIIHLNQNEMCASRLAIATLLPNSVETHSVSFIAKCVYSECLVTVMP